MGRAEAAAVKSLERKAGAEGTDDHDTFKGQVDNAGMFGVHAAQGDQHQGHRKNNGQTDDIRQYVHAFTSFFLLPERILVRIPLISSEKAAR